MKKIYCLLATAMLIVTLGATERPAREIKIGNKAIINASAMDMEIVIDAKAPKTTRFAAKELGSFLKAILGTEIKTVNAPTTDKVSFILGINEYSKAAGVDEKKLVRDAFIIKTVGKKIYIAGRDDANATPERAIASGGAWSHHYERGTLFGVYDFLERFAGVRMYFPGELGTVIPKANKLAIPEITIYDRPDFTQRRVSTYWDGEYFEGANPKAIINPEKNRNHYRLRLETDYLPCCHGLNHFKYIQRFGKSHPEYFALMSNGTRSNDPNGGNFTGQLCYTSNLVEVIYQDIRSYLKGEKADVRKIPNSRNNGYTWGFNVYKGKYVDVMPQDAFSGCHCEKCQAAYKKGDYHYATELIWGNTVNYANRLKKEGIKGYITMMAYPPYRRVPAFDIPDNIVVMVAETGPWSKGNPKQLKENNAEIIAWTKKLNRKVWIWNYANKGATLTMSGVPQMSPRAYGEYYSTLAPYIFGAFAESESDRFLYNYLNYYIFAKVAWDNKADFNAILDEHYRLMFGKAAPVMKKFYEFLENNWVNKIAGRTIDTTLGPVGAPPSDYILWHEIYSPTVFNSMEKELKSAIKLVGAQTIEGKRIALIEKEFLLPLKAASAKYMEITSAVAGHKYYFGSTPGKALQLVPYTRNKTLKKCVATSVQLWRTASDLAIKFTCDEPEMASIVEQKRKLDDNEIWKDNSVEIFLNPSGDRKTYYQLMINSLGSISDQKLTKLGANSSGDYAWNSQAAIKIDKSTSSWSATVTIPLKNLPGIKAEFPANFARSRFLKQSGDIETLYHWSIFAKGFHDLENYGIVSFGKDPSILYNGDMSIAPTKSKRHFGVWEGNKWVGGWIAGVNGAVLDKSTFISAPCSIKVLNGAITHYLPTLKPSTKYRLSFYVKLEGVKAVKRGGGVCAQLWDDKNCWFPRHNHLTGDIDWTFQRFEFTSGPKTNVKIQSYLSLRFLNATGTVWFDDVRLEEVK